MACFVCLAATPMAAGIGETATFSGEGTIKCVAHPLGLKLTQVTVGCG